MQRTEGGVAKLLAWGIKLLEDFGLREILRPFNPIRESELEFNIYTLITRFGFAIKKKTFSTNKNW